MKKYRILSAILAVVMFCGALSVLPTAAIEITYEGSSQDPTTGVIDHTASIEDYLVLTDEEAPLASPQQKLDTMKLMWESSGYQIWADAITGEVATVKTSTGDILFTNPWNVSFSKTNSLDEKKNLLSQIIVNYKDNGSSKTMNSCVDAAMRGQIKIKHIKNGIRVEYAIGRQNSRFLVPRMASKVSFESRILIPMREAVNNEISILITAKPTYKENEQPVTKDIYKEAYEQGKIEIGKSYKYYDLMQIVNPSFDMAGPVDYTYDHQYVKELLVYYTLYDPNAEGVTDNEISDMKSRYPITKKMAVYVFDEGAKNTELIKAERHIKTWVPNYSFEQLDADHLETEYEGTTKAPALFKIALEYTVDEQGLSVRLPANGIRFDESLYQLESITVLPYMGAGRSTNGGYNFFPDGSGALFDYTALNRGKNTTLTAKVYGADYAYYKVTGKHQETVRYPVFGSVEHYTGGKTVTDYSKVVSPAKYDSEGNLIKEAEYGTKIIQTKEDHGYFAIIEEGASMAEIATAHLNGSSEYNAMQMTFSPRPYDTYKMDGLSVGGDSVELTIVSDRKYVGSYKIKYVMLTDDKVAAENSVSNYYRCSWVGMAEAYRDYLEYTGTLTRLTEDEVNTNIPLYIETFGTVETVEKILSMPVNVMTPLTTFEDVKTMYKELSEAIEDEMDKIADSKDAVSTTVETAKKFNNINFRLTGYANGGMYSTMPYHLNWEEVLGGAAGFEDLVNTAREEGFGIFPDFDFAYINQDALFDGVDLMAHAVKTIDNRYTSRREYDAVYQTYVGYFELAISPAFFARFVTKFSSNYMKYNPMGVSVSTLGTALNSDFDEEDPYNREDAVQFTVSALRQLSLLRNDYGESMQVMVDGGNSYTLKYVDHIINAPLDSSRYNNASNTVPFVGMVLHGFVQYAGTPINEEGNIESALLRAIENGSGLFFKLSYQNTDVLKDFTQLSENYSIRYDIWKEDVVDMYVRLNNLLSDLQTKLIIDHEFLTANRAPDAEESESDLKAYEEAKALLEAERLAAAAREALREALALRKEPKNQADAVKAALKNAADQAIAAAKAAAKIDEKYVAEANEALKAANAANAAADAAAAELDAAQVSAIVKAKTAVLEAINAALAAGIGKADVDSLNAKAYADATEAAKKAYSDAETNYYGLGGFSTDIELAVKLRGKIADAQKAYDEAKAVYDAAVAETNSALGTTSDERLALKNARAALEKAEKALKAANDEYEANKFTAACTAAADALDAYNAAKAKSDLMNALVAATDAEAKAIEALANNEKASAIISAADLRVEADKKLAVYNGYTELLRTQLVAIETAHVAAKAEAKAAEAALELAKAAVAKLLEKLNATKNDPAATEIEKNRAEQFYNDGVKALTEAEANLAKINEEIAKIEAIKATEKFLCAKVLVFGEADIEVNLKATEENASSVTENSNDIVKRVEEIIKALADYETAKAEYDAAKAIYDELSKIDLSTLTEEKAIETRAERMAAAVAMAQAEEAMKAASETIKTNTTMFQRRYTTIVAAYKAAAEAIELLEDIKAAADALRATNTEAEAIYKLAESELAVANEAFAKAKAAFENLCARAKLAGLIDDNGELVTENKTETTPTVPELTPEEEDAAALEKLKEELAKKYVYSDGSVVAVTYGGKDGKDSAAYRTFLLNYNAFAVTVDYNGTTYEVGAYGYCVINH